MKKMMLILITVLISSLAIGQTQVGQSFDILWDHPNINDVEYFGVYFTSQSNDDEIFLEVREWTTTADSMIYEYNQQSLTAGLWEVYMTAFDRAGNESIPSESVEFIITIDAPFNIRIIRR